ncbi:MAG: VPLPA-CTERM-specific exosortase XrtD [Syntrophobacteraceae bacterium]|nr:VPLPA-CTERM-specific exosortase XrtD [Syntrophobacteraceae bacterium]
MDKSAAIYREPFAPSFSTTDAIVVAVYAVMFFALFHDSYTLMLSWWMGGDYSYCAVIPLVAASAAWAGRRELRAAASNPSWWGLGPVCASVLLYFAGELGGEYYTLYISSWLLLLGLLWLHLGREKIRTLLFSLLLLPAMFPFPTFLYRNLSLELQLLSSRLGVALIGLAGIPVFREGNVIDLGDRKLEIVQACNGLRYLLPLMVLGIILAHFLRGSLVRKACLFFTTIPLAIAMNALRIALMGIAGQQWSEGIAHDFSGWLVFMASLSLIVGEMKLLEKMGVPVAGGKDPDAGGFEAPKVPEPSRYATFVFRRKARGRSCTTLLRFFAAALLLGATLTVSMGLDTRAHIPLSRPLGMFPWTIGQWRGTPVAMEPALIDQLHPSDFTRRCYTSPGKQPVELFVAYYASQSKGKSCHSPASCIPGNGWVFEESGTPTLQTPGYGKGATRLSRAFIEKMGDKRLVYYWFPQRGRILTSLLQLKLYAFWDTILEKRSDGAMVRLITPVSASERVEHADKRLEEFTRLILPILDRFVPGRKMKSWKPAAQSEQRR